MRTRIRRFLAPNLRGCPRLAALAASLVLSACLTAAALRSRDCSWVAWLSLLPLFWAVRSLRPTAAALCGAFWGAWLYLCSTAGPAPPVASTPLALGLLTAVPAIYAGLCSRLTRRIGFNPLMLALGWILVEMALKPLGLDQGLLASTQSDATHVPWISRLLGSVFVAALVVCANASLVGILSGARLSFPASRSLGGSPNAGARALAQVVLPIQSWTLRQAQPRAPPIQVVVPAWNLVGSAHL